jgi:hypothetical protein
MHADMMPMDDFDEFLLDAEEVVSGFRDRYGTHRIGRIEDDPEMGEYESTIDLARALRCS